MVIETSLFILDHIINNPISKGMILFNDYDEFHGKQLPEIINFLEQADVDYDINRKPIKMNPWTAKLANYNETMTPENGNVIYLTHKDFILKKQPSISWLASVFPMETEDIQSALSIIHQNTTYITKQAICNNGQIIWENKLDG